MEYIVWAKYCYGETRWFQVNSSPTLEDSIDYLKSVKEGLGHLRMNLVLYYDFKITMNNQVKFEMEAYKLKDGFLE